MMINPRLEDLLTGPFQLHAVFLRQGFEDIWGSGLSIAVLQQRVIIGEEAISLHPQDVGMPVSKSLIAQLPTLNAKNSA